RQAHVERPAVGGRVGGDRGHAELAAGPDDPHRDLAAVGDQEAAEHADPRIPERRRGETRAAATASPLPDVEQAARRYHGGPDKRQWGPRTIACGQAVRATYRHMKARTLSANASSRRERGARSTRRRAVRGRGARALERSRCRSRASGASPNTP